MLAQRAGMTLVGLPQLSPVPAVIH